MDLIIYVRLYSRISGGFNKLGLKVGLLFTGVLSIINSNG